MELLLSISLVVFIAIFLFFAGVSVNHAARFRYLGARTVYVSMIFTAGSSFLLLLAVLLFILILVN